MWCSTTVAALVCKRWFSFFLDEVRVFPWAVRCWQPVAVAMPFPPRFLTVQSSWHSWTTRSMCGQLKVRPSDGLTCLTLNLHHTLPTLCSCVRTGQVFTEGRQIWSCAESKLPLSL